MRDIKVTVPESINGETCALAGVVGTRGADRLLLSQQLWRNGASPSVRACRNGAGISFMKAQTQLLSTGDVGPADPRAEAFLEP